jgi:hypothetical protein
MIRAQPRGKTSTSPLGTFVALIALASFQSARADLIDLTGNVAHDFPSSPGTTVVNGQPGSVAESSYIIQNGWTTGYLVESLRFSYDKASDTLFVGVQTYSITGDADGNGDPGFTDPQMAKAGGVNFAHFGGDKSLTIAFANVAPDGGVSTPSFVAGIPADKSTGDSRNTNDFTVSTYTDRGRGLAYSYGTILNGHVGSLEVDPSASRPNFEFALTNFSKIPGFDPTNGFYISLFLGSQQSIVVGKENIDWTKIPGMIQAPQGVTTVSGPVAPPKPVVSNQPGTVPEPSSVVLVLMGAATVLGASRFRKRA